MSTSKLTRRAFLASATTTAALTLATPRVNAARVVPKKYSPNEKMNIAGIGCGGKGTGDILSCRRENVVAMADVDWERSAEAFFRLKDAKKFKDYRKMLEEMGDEIDACTISTPDHTHAPAAYMAMSMGKHVYVQKPLAHTIAETRLLRETARKNKVITQMGNQGHCHNGVRDLCEMIWDGAIGDVKEAHIWTNRPIWPQGITEPLPEQPVPENINWDLWIGAAPFRPYNGDYAPFKWRGWWDFGCGAIGDMACHIMDPAFWSLKLIEAKHYSVEVVNQEGMNKETAPLKSVIKFQFPERADMCAIDVYWYDGGNKPERPADIPAEEQLGEGDNGSLFVGTKGYATTGCYGDDSRLLPADRMKDYKKPEKTIRRIPGESPYREWIKACKEGRQACSNFDYASRLTEVANFGNVALAAGRRLEWDVKKFTITNDKEANKFLTKEYRKGWELPV